MTESVSEKSETAPGVLVECPKCGGSLVRDHEQGVVICSTCGLVVEEGLKDRGPEWRSFDQEEEEERSRGGPPSTGTIHDKGLSTQIDYRNKDSKGQSLSPEKRRAAYRLRKWQKRSRIEDSVDRNLTFAFPELDRLCSQLGLPQSVQESAAAVYREAVMADLIRGRSIEQVVSAMVYLACRKIGIPRTLKEVAEVSRADKKEISNARRIVTRELDINLQPVDPVNYVSRFGSELNISGEVRVKAMEIVRRAREENLTSGKGPAGTAAAAIYIAALECGERKTQSAVAVVTNVTEVTLRNRYKEMVEELGLGAHGLGYSKKSNGCFEKVDSSELDDEEQGFSEGVNVHKKNGERGNYSDTGGESQEPEINMLVTWVEGNLHLYRVLSSLAEGSKSYKEIALQEKLTFSKAKKRVSKLTGKNLVKAEGDKPRKVKLTKTGEQVIENLEEPAELKGL